LVKLSRFKNIFNMAVVAILNLFLMIVRDTHDVAEVVKN